tara:strand:- start:6179 stop:7189 length:1011 start_codon:yes stop_codon:yes gene_type:complete
MEIGSILNGSWAEEMEAYDAALAAQNKKKQEPQAGLRERKTTIKKIGEVPALQRTSSGRLLQSSPRRQPAYIAGRLKSFWDKGDFQKVVMHIEQALDAGKTVSVKLFLSRLEKAINNHTEHGYTLLHVAVKGGYKKTVALLLETEGVDLEARDDWQRTPLYLLVEVARAHPQEHVEEVRVLLKAGANIYTRTKDDSTVLHCAARGGNLEMMALLVKEGAQVKGVGGLEHYKQGWMNPNAMADSKQVNAQNEEGWTPLHVAAYNGKLEIVKYLLNNKADTRIKDKKGFRAFHRVPAKGHEELAIRLAMCEASGTEAREWLKLSEKAYGKLIKKYTDF